MRPRPHDLMLSGKTKSIVGLDIEAGSAAATEVRVNGSTEVVRHGVVALDPGAFGEGEVVDAEALAEALKELFAKNKLSRNVRLGIANQRVAVRLMRLPVLDSDELENAIRFQAQDHIPMPLDQAMLDWQVIGQVEGEGGQRQLDVIAVAARREMLTAMVDAMRRAGLRPVGIDHSAFGMIRALGKSATLPVGAAGFVSAPSAVETGPMGAGQATQEAADPSATPAAGKLHCSLADATNLAVAYNDACRFTRISPFGIEAIAQRLAERRELTLEHAHQWLVHVGLKDDPGEIEGDDENVAAAREALTEGATKLADELRMSLDFYGSQEGAVAIDGIVACGRGTTIPGLVEHLQGAIGRPFEIARPLALSRLDDVTAARLTLPYGLALEQ